MNALRIFSLLVFLALLVLCDAFALAQEEPSTERDRTIIAQMSFNELALSILSVRTDLKEYPKDDLTTTSGQYELFYDETTGPCARHRQQGQLYVLCAGASLNMSFSTQSQSNRRICPEPVTNSCWKPALTKDEMRKELLKLVNRKRAVEREASTPLMSTETQTAQDE
ncbi:MAG TPA: hypothetical protein VMH26_01140 [Burkholderiales bacterium]|nr:hypothetical protein [Burkholderiales bacterium]